jgi:IS30 family transposase
MKEKIVVGSRARSRAPEMIKLLEEKGYKLEMNEAGECFSKVFKSITVDNGSEFAELSLLEGKIATKVYFAHTYSFYERGTNECHNGLIRQFIPKGNRIGQLQH